jgi:hypothetical protein
MIARPRLLQEAMWWVQGPLYPGLRVEERDWLTLESSQEGQVRPVDVRVGGKEAVTGRARGP